MTKDHSDESNHPALLDVKQVCKYLNIGSTTAYALIASGDLRAICIGRKKLVPIAEADDFIRRSAIRAGWRMPSAS